MAIQASSEGVRQGHLLIPYAFKSIQGRIRQRVLDDFEGSVKIGGWSVCQI